MKLTDFLLYAMMSILVYAAYIVKTTAAPVEVITGVVQSNTQIEGAPGAYKVHPAVGNDYWTYDYNDYKTNDFWYGEKHNQQQTHYNWY